MYNMLIEKQEALTQLTKDIGNLQSNLRAIKANFEEQVQNGNFDYINERLYEIEQSGSIDLIEERIDVTTDTVPMGEALKREVILESGSEDIKNQNELILKMHSEGFDEVEIAKRLGKGLGEIKLVLGLFNKE